MGSLEQAVYAIIISFVIGVILCPIVIPMLRKLKFGQNVRDDGPQTHLAKQGTPTMGGSCLSGGIRDYKPFLSEGKQGRRGYHADDPVLWLIGFLVTILRW